MQTFDKSPIRCDMRHLLDSLSADREAISLSLVGQLLTHPIYARSEVVATYLSLPHEWDTLPFIQQAQLDGKRVLVPKIMGPGQMIFVDYDAADLVENKWGILEPASEQAVDKSVIDLIHVPGLVFDEDGYRLGYGGGFYDRYLADYPGQTISTLHSSQLIHFPKETHDIPVKELLIYDGNQTPF